MQTVTPKQNLTAGNNFVLATLNGTRHVQSVLIYLVIVLGHFSEHIVQVAQVYLLDWQLRMAGGILGLWLPGLARSEVLHMVYNSLQLTGLIVLLLGFKGRARRWWLLALVLQSWPFLEHVVLQVQFLTGHYLFDATTQQSLLEFFFPRVELHLVYNLSVFVPTLIAVVLRVFHHGQRPNLVASINGDTAESDVA